MVGVTGFSDSGQATRVQPLLGPMRHRRRLKAAGEAGIGGNQDHGSLPRTSLLALCQHRGAQTLRWAWREVNGTLSHPCP